MHLISIVNRKQFSPSHRSIKLGCIMHLPKTNSLLSPNISSLLASAAASIRGPLLNFDMNLKPCTGDVAPMATTAAISAIRWADEDGFIFALWLARDDMRAVSATAFRWVGSLWGDGFDASARRHFGENGRFRFLRVLCGKITTEVAFKLRLPGLF